MDSNVLLDMFTEDPTWSGWSGAALAEARDAGALVINPVIYAEVSVRFDRIEELDEALPAADFLREDLPYPAGFLAGKAYLRYGGQGGSKRSPLADFYIGAHAAVAGYYLVTRDPARYRTHLSQPHADHSGWQGWAKDERVTWSWRSRATRRPPSLSSSPRASAGTIRRSPT